jgi:hypothetical protein
LTLTIPFFVEIDYVNQLVLLVELDKSPRLSFFGSGSPLRIASQACSIDQPRGTGIVWMLDTLFFLSQNLLDHFFFLFFPALLSAIATACFRGLPAFISVLMLLEIAFFDLPFFRGMIPPKALYINPHILAVFGHG